MKQIRGMWFPDDDTHFQQHLEKEELINERGTYQLKKLRAAVGFVPPSERGLAIDIGAHVGLWTHVLATMFKHVYAFEPHPILYACWERNCNTFENVEGFNLAVSQSDTDIRVEYVEGNSGNARVGIPGTGRGHLTRAVSIDNFDIDARVAFIKIDVEGWEYFVLKGAEQTIKAHKPVIILEQKPGNAERYNLSRTAGLEYLLSLGMNLVWEKSGDYVVKFA